MRATNECFISVDVECSGPIPGDYSMLSLGACLIGNPDEGFYVELKPLNENAIPAALEVSGLNMAQLAKHGATPKQAMAKLRAWVKKVAGERKPVFVGFNAGFDWSFVNWYLIHFGKENPFGFAPLDIKSYYMGRVGCAWDETKSSRIRKDFQPRATGDHHALNDARAQAEMFDKMRTSARRGRRGAR